MLKWLYRLFGGVPYLGGFLKAAYIASLVAKLKLAAQDWAPSSAAGQSGAELDQLLTREAQRLIREALGPMKLGRLAGTVEQSAVRAVVGVMRRRLVG